MRAALCPVVLRLPQLLSLEDLVYEASEEVGGEPQARCEPAH